MFKLGRISPPDYTWTNRTLDGEWELVPSSNEVWAAMIDHEGPVGMCQSWHNMIEIYGDTEEMVTFIAEQICDKMNDPKTQFMRYLKIGE